MAISNASSGFRPGVCTFNTRPVSPFNGQVIYETDTKQTLVWQGTTWVMLTDADTPPGLQLITTQSFSGVITGSPFNVQSVFSSDFDNYKIVFRWYGSVATNAQIRLLSGTNTVQNGNQYYRYGFYYNAGTFTNFNASNQTESFLGNHNTASFIPSHTNIEIYGPNLSTTRTMWDTVHFDAQSGLTANFTTQYADTTQYTGFQIYPTSGTATGTIRVYGYRNTI